MSIVMLIVRSRSVKKAYFLSLTEFELRRLQLVQNSLCRVFPLPLNSLTLPPSKKPPLAPSQVQGTILNRPHYTQNSQLGSTSLPNRINSPLHLFQKYKAKHPQTHVPSYPHFRPYRVHKSIKHFSNSFSHYAPVLWNSFPFQIRNSPSVACFRKHLKTHLFNSSFPI